MKFTVYGEYGPQGGQYIEEEIEAETPGEARLLFAQKVETENPSLWKYIGLNNTHVENY